MHFLITAGGTREYIDPVRFISNASSGKMGFALARAALASGHNVTLITTVEKSKIKNQKSKLRIISVETSAEMFKAVKKHFPRCDCLLMAAAVADYTPIRPAKTKIKSSQKELTIKLKPTPDILKWASLHKKSKIENRKLVVSEAEPSKMKRHRRLVVGFALEDKNLRANAERKMREKNLDMIIANIPAAIGTEMSTVQIKTLNSSWIKIENVTKAAIARRITALIEEVSG